MKKTVIRIISTTIALLLLAAFIFVSGAVLTDARHDNREAHLLCGWYDTEDTQDVIFIGDCEVYEGFVPVVLYEEYGITSYIRGSSQQTIWQSYHILEETLERSTPRAVVFNVLSMKYDTTPREEISRMSLEDMRPSRHKLEAILDSMTEDESLISYFLPVLRYHSRWSELDGDDFAHAFDKHIDITHQGYLMQTDIVPVDSTTPTTPDTLIDPALPSRSFEYLDRMTALCKEKGVELILIKAPTNSVKYYWYDEWDAQVEKYALDNALTYYSMVGLDEEIGIDYSTDTYDKGLHLNVYGAEKLTKYFGRILSDAHSIPDRRGDSALDALWGERADAYYAERNKEK